MQNRRQIDSWIYMVELIMIYMAQRIKLDIQLIAHFKSDLQKNIIEFSLICLNNINMNIERHQTPQYRIQNFEGYELDPTSTHKIKRIFRATHPEMPDKIYRILVYPHLFVEVESLIAQLKFCKQQSHKMLGKISLIFQETYLSKINSEDPKQKVIAVAIEDDFNSNFVSLLQLMMLLTQLSEKLSKQLILSAIDFISSMSQQGISYFNSNDLHIDLTSGQIRYDILGDRKYFKEKIKYFSDSWEIGKMLFTCIQGFPPYNPNDVKDLFPFLEKNNFQKYWKKMPKPAENIVEFINLSFTKDTNLQILKASPYLSNQEILNDSDIIAEINAIKAQKESCTAAAKGKKLSSRIQQKIKSRYSVGNRSSNTVDESTLYFSQKLQKEENEDRKLPRYPYESEQLESFDEERQHITIAHLLTILNDEQLRDGFNIQEIKDKGTSIEFLVVGVLKNVFEIRKKVVINLYMSKSGVRWEIERMQGDIFECMWIQNKISNMLQQI